MPTTATEFNTDVTSPEVPQGTFDGGFPFLSRSLAARVNPASVAIRERSLQDRELMNERNYAVKLQQMELQKVHDMSEMLKEQVRISDSMEKHRQTMLAAKFLSNADHTAPDFEQKLLEAQAKNPLGFEDEMIQKSVAYRRSLNELKARSETSLQEFKDRQAAETQAQVDREKALKDLRASTAGAEEYEKAKAAIIAKSEADKGIPTGVRERHAKLVGDLAQGKPSGMTDQKEIMGWRRGVEAEKSELERQYPMLDPNFKPVTTQPDMPVVQTPTATTPVATPTPQPSPEPSKKLPSDFF